MKTRVTIRHFTQLAVAAALLGASGLGRAGDSGHYVGGMMDIRDYFVPDPGYYGALYNYFYTSSRYNDQNGNKVSSVEPQLRPGTPANVNVDLNMYVLAPAFIWVSPWKILGAKYGADIVPTFANSSFDAIASTVRGRGGSGTEATFAPGDLFVQPVWLGWSFSHWDLSAAYGFYAPVGKYSTDAETTPVGTVNVPASDNIGLGFWTQQFQAAGAWYPWTNHATAVTAALTYEYNSEQEGTGITYGQNLWLNWGISQYLPLTKDDKLLLEIGPAGYYEWQVSASNGGTSDPSSRTHVGGIGGQLGVTYVPWNLILNFRGFYEYYADERVQGSSFSINVVKKF
jgi:hypothetical protein